MLEIFDAQGNRWDNFTKFPASELDIDNANVGDFKPHTAKLTVNPNDPKELSEDLMKLHFVGYMSTQKLERLILPYIPGARADKSPFHGSLAYADMINYILMHNADIVVVDPHSEQSTLVFGFDVSVIEAAPLIQTAVSQFIPYTYDAVIAPDRGAVERASAYANAVNIPCYYATKSRDPHTGKLTNYDVSNFASELKPHGKYLVVDDICDGGGTFKLLSEAIEQSMLVRKLDLWVTHGLFTGKADTLPEYYDSILTTNSVIPMLDVGQHVLNIDEIFWKETN